MGAFARVATWWQSKPWSSAVPMATLLIALASTGCSSPPSSMPTTTSTMPTSSTTSPSAPTTRATYSLYFLRGSYLGVAHRTTPTTPAIATTAVSVLVGGTDGEEAAAGLTSAIPPGTRVLGLRIASGTATVDLSRAYATPASPAGELARVAQVVYTLTQFPNVKTVAFEIAGSSPTTFASGAVSLQHPLGRSDVLGALPAILVETPAVGDTLHGSVRLSGLANVFEAQFKMQLITGNGSVLLDEDVHATAGTGTWGTFDARFSLAASATSTCTLRVYDVSMKDGSPINEVDLHLVTGP